MNNFRVIDHRHAPRQQWTALCPPDDVLKTLIRDDGALLYDPVPGKGFARIFYPGMESRRGVSKINQRTESAEFPCVETRMEYPQAWLRMRTFASRDEAGNRTDVVLWEIEAKPGVRDLKGRFRVTVEIPEEALAVDADGHRLLATPKKSESDAGKTEAQGQPVALFFPDAVISRNNSFGGLVQLEVMTKGKLLQGGDKVFGVMILPLRHGAVDGFSYEWALQALERERAFWTKWVKDHISLSIPDPAVQEMVVACARNIFQAREIKKGLPEFQVGAAIYRGLWVLDGHFILEAAHFLGCGDDARSGWEALLRRVRPNGAIAESEGHLKETGISLATFVRQTELTGDWERLRSIWPVMLNGLKYIRTLRDQAAAAPADSAEYRLLPPTGSDGGLNGERAELTTTLWTLFGLKEAAKAARQLGLGEDANLFQTEFDSLLADFQRVAKKCEQRLPDGTPYLPMCLPGSGDHCQIPNFKGEILPWDKINPGTATWAFAHAIYPGQVLGPDDALVKNFTHLLDSIDDEQGIPANTGWQAFQSVWGYAASFYAHVWLYAGNPAKAVDYLYSFANHSSPTRVWREEQPFDRRMRICAETCRITGPRRNSSGWCGIFSFLSGEMIWNCFTGCRRSGGPRAERPLLLPGSPTRFGPVSLSLRREKGEAILRVELASDWSVKPKEVRVRIPGRAAEILIDGKKTGVPENRILVLPAHEEIRFAL